MTEAKMTWAEFVSEARRLIETRSGRPTHAWHDMASLAESAGVQWKPEKVEPVAGELLTARTREVPGTIAWEHDDVTRRVAAICNGPGDWYITGYVGGHGVLAVTGYRIVHVPGSPPAEPGKPAEELGGPSTHEYRESSGWASVYGCAVCGFSRAEHVPAEPETRVLAHGNLAEARAAWRKMNGGKS